MFQRCLMLVLQLKGRIGKNEAAGNVAKTAGNIRRTNLHCPTE